MPFAKGLSDRARKAVRATLQEIGRNGRDHIRDKISVPVQRVGSTIIRSDPGEPPRMEHKRLWKAVRYRVKAKAVSLAELVIYVHKSRADVAAALEYGTSKIEPRPFWEISEKEIRRNVRGMFRDLFRKHMGRTKGSPPTPGDVTFEEL